MADSQNAAVSRTWCICIYCNSIGIIISTTVAFLCDATIVNSILLQITVTNFLIKLLQEKSIMSGFIFR